MEPFTVIAVESGTVLVLAALYFLLALFRAAQLELPRVRMGSVLREAGRTDGLLERWTRSPHRSLLPLAVLVAFQAILVLATLLVVDLARRLFPDWGVALRLGAAFGATFLVLVVGLRILLVRVLVYAYPEAAIRMGGRVATAAGVVLLPLLLPLDRLLQSFSTGAAGGPDVRSETEMEEEVHAFVSMGEEEGILEKEEVDLVRNVVDFGDTVVREIMTPRTDMVLVDRTTTLGQVRELFLQAKHSRLPVQDGTVDRIVGLLNIKDILPVWSEPADTPVADRIRPVLFVPETKKILDLLREMQRDQVPFAMVVDEYGGTAGLVTVEDIVEELVGEIQDEHEDEPPDVTEESPGVWLVSGFAHVDEIAELLDMDVNGMDVDTIGGLVTTVLGHVPEPGESVTHTGVRLEVVAADGRRVRQLRVRREGSPQGGDPRADGGEA